MGKKVYDIRSKIAETIKLEKGRNVAALNFYNALVDYPVERAMFYPGKLYVFKYYSKEKGLSDTTPYIMSLGHSKKDKEIFYGINMHYIPYDMRLQIFCYIYDVFEREIQKDILEFPEIEDVVKQNYIIYLTVDYIRQISGSLKLDGAIKEYSIKNVQSPRCVNFNKIHYMLMSDENTFNNGSIVDAQKEFVTTMMKK